MKFLNRKPVSAGVPAQIKGQVTSFPWIPHPKAAKCQDFQDYGFVDTGNHQYGLGKELLVSVPRPPNYQIWYELRYPCLEGFLHCEILAHISCWRCRPQRWPVHLNSGTFFG